MSIFLGLGAGKKARATGGLGRTSVAGKAAAGLAQRERVLLAWELLSWDRPGAVQDPRVPALLGTAAGKQGAVPAAGLFVGWRESGPALPRNRQVEGAVGDYTLRSCAPLLAARGLHPCGRQAPLPICLLQGAESLQGLAAHGADGLRCARLQTRQTVLDLAVTEPGPVQCSL